MHVVDPAAVDRLRRTSQQPAGRSAGSRFGLSSLFNQHGSNGTPKSDRSRRTSLPAVPSTPKPQTRRRHVSQPDTNKVFLPDHNAHPEDVIPHINLDTHLRCDNPRDWPRVFPMQKRPLHDVTQHLYDMAFKYGNRLVDQLDMSDLAMLHEEDSELLVQLRQSRGHHFTQLEPHAMRTCTMASAASQFTNAPFTDIFGAPLSTSTKYAASIANLGELEVLLPTLVVSCVEALYRTNIYGPDLFKTKGSAKQLGRLIQYFERPQNSFGSNETLEVVQTADICSLLLTYFDEYPKPLVHDSTSHALWEWCAAPSLKRDERAEHLKAFEIERKRAMLRGGTPVVSSTTWKLAADAGNSWRLTPEQEDEEKAAEDDRVIVAALLLELVPTANLSLLMYMCSFMKHLPAKTLSSYLPHRSGDLLSTLASSLLGWNMATAKGSLKWILARWDAISERLVQAQKLHSAVQARSGKMGYALSKPSGFKPRVFGDVFAHGEAVTPMQTPAKLPAPVFNLQDNGPTTPRPAAITLDAITLEDSEDPLDGTVGGDTPVVRPADMLPAPPSRSLYQSPSFGSAALPVPPSLSLKPSLSFGSEYSEAHPDCPPGTKNLTLLGTCQLASTMQPPPSEKAIYEASTADDEEAEIAELKRYMLGIELRERVEELAEKERYIRTREAEWELERQRMVSELETAREELEVTADELEHYVQANLLAQATITNIMYDMDQ